MEARCPGCGHSFETQAAVGLKDACPKCLAEFVLAGAPTVTGEHDRLSPLQPGGIFHGLEILDVLGKGGMGVVYRARQPGLNREVALKLLSPALAGDAQFSHRFNREARTLAGLNHPNIVHVYDFGEDQGHYFLVMECVDGLSLRELMNREKLKPGQAFKIVPQICDALEYAHEKGVVHRDIKPENILIDNEGRVKIADFGLAKVAGAASSYPVTRTDAAMGTPHYMAPEQYMNIKGVDHRADIYSLGVVFYEMLTGELPMGKFPPPSRKVTVDVRIDEIVLHTLEKEPEQRYQRARLVKEDVTRVATSPSVGPSLSPHGFLSFPAGVRIGAIVILLGLTFLVAMHFMPTVDSAWGSEVPASVSLLIGLGLVGALVIFCLGLQQLWSQAKPEGKLNNTLFLFISATLAVVAFLAVQVFRPDDRTWILQNAIFGGVALLSIAGLIHFRRAWIDPAKSWRSALVPVVGFALLASALVLLTIASGPADYLWRSERPLHWHHLGLISSAALLGLFTATLGSRRVHSPPH